MVVTHMTDLVILIVWCFVSIKASTWQYVKPHLQMRGTHWKFSCLLTCVYTKAYPLWFFTPLQSKTKLDTEVEINHLLLPSFITKMAEAIMGFTSPQLHIYNHPVRANKAEMQSFSKLVKLSSAPGWYTGSRHEGIEMKTRRSPCKVKALPYMHLMAVMVEHMEGQRDILTTKTVWHLSDETIKSVYTMYIMFTCWGCCFFGAMKDPYYDSEQYRSEGGDGTGHWVYEKQEEIEEAARAELWREELIEEIELKVGGLRELEEAGKKEEMFK